VKASRLRGGLEHLPDERDRWRAEARLIEFLHRFGLDEASAPESASGGERKRAALALAFALEPDLCCSTSPRIISTSTRSRSRGARAEGTRRDRDHARPRVPRPRRDAHRRARPRAAALVSGQLRRVPGAQDRPARREEAAKRKFDKFWAQEEAWIRKGVEARRTRNEGRVQRLEALRVERAARRQRLGDVKLALDAGARSGRLVAELVGVTKRYDGRPIVRDLTTQVMRGDRSASSAATAPASRRCSS
jgi:ATP-binding cassette subfamily F protein uup